MQPVRSARNPLDLLIMRLARRFGARAREVERFLKFSIVGAIGAVVDFGTLFLLQATVLPPENRAAVALATSMGFLAAILNNFLWNRYWTYPDSRSRPLRRQLLQFMLINLVGWLGRTLWVTWSFSPLGELLMPAARPALQLLRPDFANSPTAAAKLGTICATVIGIIAVMFWNFFANRHWTYGDVD